MPLFDFICRQCGVEFEELVWGSMKPSCPSCGDKRVKKLLSAPARTGGKSEQAGGSSGSKCSGCAGGSCGSCR